MTASPASTRSRLRKKLEWLVAAAVILALTTFLMRDWLIASWTPNQLPTSSRKEVLTELAIVWLFRQELLQGHILSEWNPYWFAGFPWLRYLSYPLYYALAAVSAWGGVSLESAQVAFFFLVLAASGLVMFGYLHQVLEDWRAALIGGVIYQAFPYHNHVGVETWIHAAFWAILPLILWLIELSRTRGQRRIAYLLLAGVALGCFPVISSEYAILAGPFVVLYLLLRQMTDARHGRQTWMSAIGSLILVGLVAIGISAFFVIPALAEIRYVGIHAKHGAGTTFTDQLLREYSVTPALVWYAIARRFHFTPGTEGLPGIVRSFWSIAWYPGVIPPALAALGLTGLRRRFLVKAALAGALLATLSATGPTCVLNLFTHLPVLGRLPPFRGTLLVVACLAVLAGFGMQWALRRAPRRWSSWTLLLAALLLIVIDFRPSAAAYGRTDSYFTTSERQAYAWLAQRQSNGRLADVATLPRDQYLRSYSLSEAPIPRSAGYYDNAAPLYAWQQGAWTDLRTLLRLRDVRYVMLRHGEPGVDQFMDKLRSSGYSVAYESGNVQVWENPDTPGYAQLYGSAALDVTQDFHHSFKALPEFVWREIAMVATDSFYLDDHPLSDLQQYDYLLVDQPATRDPAAREPLLRSLGSRFVTADDLTPIDVAPTVEVSIWPHRLGYENISVEVQTPTRGVLTIAESWYPHWQVWVDGQPGQVLRVNWAFLGVWLEPGMHRVSFRFRRPWYVYAGYAITLLSLLGLITWGTWYASNRIGRSHARAREALAIEQIAFLSRPPE